MRLISFHPTPNAQPRLGVVAAGRALPAASLGPGVPASMDDLLADTSAGLSALRAAWDDAHVERDGVPLGQLSLVAPVPRPGKLIGIGRNYPDHVTEQGAIAPQEPLIFAKFTTAIIGDQEPIHWDPALSAQVDYEAELGVVIGWQTRHVSEAEALKSVLGYTLINDVSARDLQARDKQWVRAKSLDSFCPIGPALVTADEIADPTDLLVECRVNGVLLQSARTSEMFYSVAQIISYCSRSFTLEPGDVIATGTPGGVGAFRDPPIWLHHGDTVVVSVEGIGELTNPCVEEGHA